MSAPYPRAQGGSLVMTTCDEELTDEELAIEFKIMQADAYHGALAVAAARLRKRVAAQLGD